jgi:hypothetical protein
MAQTHLIGLLLGTEDDWPTAFEQYLARLAPRIEYGGDTPFRRRHGPCPAAHWERAGT